MPSAQSEESVGRSYTNVPEISYEKLRQICKNKNVSFYKIRQQTKIGEFTEHCIRTQSSVTLTQIDRLCAFLNCQPCDIMDFTPTKEPASIVMDVVRVVVDFDKFEKLLKDNHYTLSTMSLKLGYSGNYFSCRKRLSVPSITIPVIEQLADVLKMKEAISNN